MLAGLALGLAIVEFGVRLTGVDERLLAPLLYLQGADLAVHQADAGAARHYSLKPGARAVFDGRRVNVNSRGFRGAERPAAKPAGVFRVVCLGGSNTYGAAVADEETYPAQLERELNKKEAGRYEVWNAGVSGYVLAQDAAKAEESIGELNPDMLIFMRTNRGRRAFLPGQDPKPYFDAEPGLYAENLPFLPLAESALGRGLLVHWRGYRALILALNQVFGRLRPGWRLAADDALSQRDEDRVNVPALRRFYEKEKDRRAVLLAIHPRNLQEAALDQLPVPNIYLGRVLPAGAGPEYRLLHPPAAVYAWYARTLAPYVRAAARPRPVAEK